MIVFCSLSNCFLISWKSIRCILVYFSTVSTFAQSEGESVKPIGGITLYRNVSLAAIEQNNYLDVIVKFKAAELGDYFTNGVKVVVVDNNTGKRFIGSDF